MEKQIFKGSIIKRDDHSIRFLCETPYYGEMSVNYNKATLTFPLHEGMKIQFESNGIMTASIPPQLYAASIQEYQEGITFKAILRAKGKFLKVEDIDPMSPYYGSEILVRYAVKMPHLEVGSNLEISYNGIMTRYQ